MILKCIFDADLNYAGLAYALRNLPYDVYCWMP